MDGCMDNIRLLAFSSLLVLRATEMQNMLGFVRLVGRLLDMTYG
jgi:hypothetical protein